MRIHRYHSRLTFRKRRRKAGCLPFVVLLGVLVGVGALSWSWIQGRVVSLSAPIDTSSDAKLAAALNAFNRGELDNSIAFAREALDKEPHRAEATVIFARSLIYRSYSDYDNGRDRRVALEETTRALQQSPTNPDVMAIHALALTVNGQHVSAADTARRILETHPEHALARTALALAYSSVGSFEIARRESETAINGSGWQMDALRVNALALSNLGDYKNAVKTVDRAINLHAHLNVLYFEKALYAMQIGDADTATHAYYQILTFDPQNVKARLRLCELSSTMREREAAIRYCSEVTQLAPSWADGWHKLGREYFLQGNFAQARDHLNKCSSLQVMQNVPVKDLKFECWYLQGQAAEILGDCPALVATYNEFRLISADSDVKQTWAYPPEGPPGC